MPTYADELRRLASLLEEDFNGNREQVARSLRGMGAQISEMLSLPITIGFDDDRRVGSAVIERNAFPDVDHVIALGFEVLEMNQAGQVLEFRPRVLGLCHEDTLDRGKSGNPSLHSPSEAVYDFAGFLTTREEAITVGASHDASAVASLCEDFCERRGFRAPREGWEKITPPQPTEGT